MSNQQQRIMSGMRPTGKLHIGHYMGVLKNWVKLQNDYKCYFMIADWHALTTKFDKTEHLKQHVLDAAIDWLACGINPDNSTIYLQSLVPEIAELHVLLSMITPQNWVERDPTLKDMVKILRGDKEDTEQNISNIVSYGLMGYPVLQTADILAFNASVVPVGTDQLAHLEISRDIARRFNHIYKTNLFNEPKPKLTETPLLKGLDGQKMGKSFHNDIKLSDSAEDTAKKIMKAITDRSRLRKTDPGHPEDCEVVYEYYKIFASENLTECVESECKNATRGCADCKRQLAGIINEYFADIRTRRLELEKNLDYVHSVIKTGSNKAREEANLVLTQVKDAMNLYS